MTAHTLTHTHAYGELKMQIAHCIKQQQKRAFKYRENGGNRKGVVRYVLYLFYKIREWI